MTDTNPSVHVFGIRHHGPGSAASLVEALKRLQPDAILIEGPPDADKVLPLLNHQDMRPPVALLVYAPDEPRKAAFFPFAVFSPEWQALKYAFANDVPVRFMDLPQTYAILWRDQLREKNLQPLEGEEVVSDQTPLVREDPLGALAKAAGYNDGERWWEHMVEQRRDGHDLFDALLEAMTALRDELDEDQSPYGQMVLKREAFMRKTIRTTLKAGAERVAVVCGAWHAPALTLENMPTISHDNALLKGMKKIKVKATWIPWTHGRLTKYSGYGAGVWSPGWYQHLWETEGDVSVSWLTKVARMLRDEDLDASTAQIIDAVRLAETLAALRDLPAPTLSEYNEAVLTVLCHANQGPMQLIFDKLIVGETLGNVPNETPMVPIQRDLQKQQKSLRMRVSPELTTLSLDQRNPGHLDRSHLLHRLLLLDVPWGRKETVKGKQGTFHEVWKMQWVPELTIKLIERSVWGNTVYDAATTLARQRADDAPDLPVLTDLVREVLVADLPDAVAHVVHRLQEVSALTGDISLLMASLPALAEVLLYGNVRKTDAGMVRTVVDGIVTRVTIGLPVACTALADDAAQEMFKLVLEFHRAVRLLQNDVYQRKWHLVLQTMVKQSMTHGLIRGRCCRILLDVGIFKADEAVRHMRQATSRVETPNHAAAWLEGFLHGSGLILLHNEILLNIIDEWVMALDDELFIGVLPLLRRLFTTFTDPERKEIGRLIKRKGDSSQKVDEPTAIAELDEVRANSVLPIIAQLLGIDNNN
jgi:hypothetical protein